MSDSKIIKINFTIQLTLGIAIWVFRGVEYLLHSPLEVGRGVGQPKRHPVPFKLTPVADEGS
jgi:hypothetical protein